MSIRRAALAAALLPLAAGASVLELNPDGTGQALFLPHYTVHDNQTTLLALANNTDRAKAVRINFVEAMNGQIVLMFNLYLGPRDSWSAAVLIDGLEGARMLSTDGSCTAPAMFHGGFPLANYEYWHNQADEGPHSLLRTRSGAIEIIEMGTLDIDPTDCDAINARLDEGGRWLTEPNADIGPPGGGLSASVHVVNVGAGTVYTLPASAVDGFSPVPHHRRLDERLRFSEPVAGEHGFRARVDGRVLDIDASRPPDAISALYMTPALHGDYRLQSELGARSEWLLAFPTKHAYVSFIEGNLRNEGPAVAPFTRGFEAQGACEPVPASSVDVDGEAERGSLVTLCSQIERVRFGVAGIAVAGEEGRARLDLVSGRPPLRARVDGEPVELHGLPVFGFRLSSYLNGQLAGAVLANYSEAEPLQRGR